MIWSYWYFFLQHTRNVATYENVCLGPLWKYMCIAQRHKFLFSLKEPFSFHVKSVMENLFQPHYILFSCLHELICLGLICLPWNYVFHDSPLHMKNVCEIFLCVLKNICCNNFCVLYMFTKTTACEIVSSNNFCINLTMLRIVKEGKFL